MDELGPISSFLDQGACKNTLLPQLDYGLEDTEATVQDDHIPLVEYGGKHPKQLSICGTHVVKFLLPKISGMILALHKIYPPHDATGAGTDGMILIPNDHGLWGMNMNPGHVNLFVQTLMLLSRQFIYPGTKFSNMFTPHASTICWISQNLLRNVGGNASVKDIADKMVSKCFLLIQLPILPMKR